MIMRLSIYIWGEGRDLNIIQILLITKYYHTVHVWSLTDAFLCTCRHLQIHNWNFKRWTEDLHPEETVQSKAYSVSPWQRFAHTYRHCITFQYCTEMCRQRSADTSKGLWQIHTARRSFTATSQPFLGLARQARGRGQAWLKPSADILKHGILHFPPQWLKVIKPACG